MNIAQSKRNISLLFGTLLLALVMLPSCNKKYGCPAAISPVDYNTPQRGMGKKVKKQSHSSLFSNENKGRKKRKKRKKRKN